MACSKQVPLGKQAMVVVVVEEVAKVSFKFFVLTSSTINKVFNLLHSWQSFLYALYIYYSTVHCMVIVHYGNSTA